jgi:acyl transferase domain-containing protein
MAVEQRTELTPLQNAVYLLKQAQAKLAALEYAQSEPIAIIGMACRFPGGASSPEAFWRMVAGGIDAVREVPPDRWDIDDYYDPDPAAPGKMNTRWGGFLERVDEFDCEFFGISPREAVRVDPQHRLLLEVAWEALEDAGLPSGDVAQTRAGVYVGVIGNDYALMQSKDLSDMDVFSGTGSSHAILANRLSYVLNLNGPSIALDTACSSSLVTIHLACQSLRRRESDLALAGGVNLMLSPEMTLALTKAHMMAPDGRCKTFDAAADGYVRGEGCGMIVLKRLSDAVAAGDRIIALVRGSAVNHDGRSNGLSAPNGPAQEAVIRAALADAHLAPGEVSYIEAHGTGTRLGDPIEIEALGSVLGKGRSPDRRLVVGSVKTNIGHLESAAGIAGLIKIVLMLRHGQIPPHLHLQTVNPLLRLEDLRIDIPTSLRDWPREAAPRRAAVSSFGFGGTNAHVILQEPPREEPQKSPLRRPRHVVTLSARSAQALSELADRYANFAEANPSASLADVAYTANVGRTHFTHRAAVIAGSLEELRNNLRRIGDDPPAPGVRKGVAVHDRLPRIAFLFTGQGAQYAGMGRALYLTQPTFRAAIDRCAEILRSHLDRPLLSLLDGQADRLLDQTGYTQPVMFALEYALATLWRSWGIEPAAVMGHSVGEFVAACAAGVFSLEDGLRLIAQRARLMQSLPPGGVMGAVFACEAQVTSALQAYAGRVAIAALNGPESIVISGDEPAVRELLGRFENEGVRSKLLATSHAFHSQRMDPILDPLRQAAESVTCSAPRIDLVSNLTGQLANQQLYADPGYWSAHARSPVRFAESMKTLAELGCEIFLEIGPGPTLIGMGQRCLPEGNYAWLPSLRPGRDDWQTLLESLAELYVRGAKVDWMGFDRDYHPRKRELPSYPFQRRRYWANPAVNVSQQGLSLSRQNAKVLHPLLGRRLAAAVSEQVFEAQIAANRPATLADHKIQGAVVMPGAAYLEMALAATAAVHGKPWNVRNASLLEPLLLDKMPKTVQTILTPEGPHAASFRIVSVTQPTPDAEPSFATHAAGRVELPADTDGGTIDLEAARARFTGEPRDAKWQTEALRTSGLEPGPTFSWSLLHWLNERETLSEVRAACDVDRADDYYIHPGLLDTAFQLLGAALPGAGTNIDAYVPMSVDRLHFVDRLQGPGRYLASITSLESNLAVGDVRLMDAAGRVLMKLEGLRLRRVPRDWLVRLVSGPLPDWCYELAWVTQPLDAASEDGKPVEPGHWLIFDSADGVGAALARGLTVKAHHCKLVPSGGDPQSRRAAVREFCDGSEPGRRGIVHLAGLSEDGRQESPDFAAARRDGWGGALDIVQAAATSGGAKPPRLWLVTRGAVAVGDSPLPLSLAQSPIWGLGRVVAAEHPELTCTRIDLDPQDHRGAAEQLIEELWSWQGEDQVAYRGGERRVARLRHLQHGDAGALDAPRGQPYRLEITARGQLDQVALRPMTRQPPGPGQVEIQVRATGLNFRDVLNVLDLYPGDPGPLGGECSGEVVAVGAGVERFKPGDQVVALAPASFASYAVTLGEFVAPKPEHLSFEEAATIPICFLTTHYALRRLGNVQRGERVLIHAASGGVGIAAIQIAKQVGAEIFATAGSPRKREYLKSLGIEHVFDSRSLDFKDQIMAATSGQGVDLVVNSLTGEAIAASLSLLREGGRFLELGKTDLWDQPRVDRFRPGLTFHAIALDRMMAEQPKLVEQLMGDVLPQFVQRRLDPLPLRTFGIRRVVDALRHMARAEHIGKVVIQAAAENDLGKPAFSLRDDGTYLVTGGLGGLGLKVARWLVDRGARHLILLGRSGVTEEGRLHLESLEEAGVHVAVRKCDVADRAALAAVLSEAAGEMPPLRGVFHLAGVLDDGVLRDQTRERFDRVMAAKMLGAWNLHDLTRDRPLEQFVLFSSAAALLGSPGQGNYAAANAFLDALAHHRRWQKLPALSVNWGSWAEVGMAARLKDSEGRRWSAAGVGWIEPARGMETLERLMAEGRTQVGVLPMDWPKFFDRIPSGSEPAWLLDIAREARAAGSSTGGGPPLLLEKLQSVTPAEWLEVALTYIRQQAARILAMDDANLPDPHRTLNEVGFDSLTGVEFCNRVGQSIGQHLNPAVLFDYPTLESFAGYVVRDVLHLESESVVQSPPAKADEAADETRQQALADVEVMSEEEMDALVTQQLDKLT